MSTPGVPSRPVVLTLISLIVPISDFLKSLSKTSSAPIFVAEVARWVHEPEDIDAAPLTSSEWDYLIICEGTTSLSQILPGLIRTSWSISAKVPLEMIDNLVMAKNSPSDIPPLPRLEEDDQDRTSDEGVSLSITPELDDWSQSFSASVEGSKPVVMLNLLAYASKEKYLGYIKAFNEDTGTNYGGAATLIGEVVASDEEETEVHVGSNKWDDVVLVQYPSVNHFVQMIKSEGYKKADRKWKTGALGDTGLLCVVEVDA